MREEAQTRQRSRHVLLSLSYREVVKLLALHLRGVRIHVQVLTELLVRRDVLAEPTVVLRVPASECEFVYF